MQPAKLLNQIVEGSLLEDRARSSVTRQEFCAIERMSLTTYAKLQKAGLGPDEVRFPGLSFVRITPAARAEWHAKIEANRQSQQVSIERQRRSELASRAGKKAAESENHICRRRAAANAVATSAPKAKSRAVKKAVR